MENFSNNMILDLRNAANGMSWEAIDDRIMGGLSKSHPEYIENVGLRFSGTVSLRNNGGFASIRSNTTCLDLSRYSGLKLRICGDGRTYKISLRTDLFYDGVSYQASFVTAADEWQEICLPFAQFTPTHHGIKLTTVAEMDTAALRSLGFFIADRQEGPFQLDIAWIQAFSET